MNTILITGATNQIGFFLLPLLLQQGRVVALSRQAGLAPQEGLRWLQGDLQMSLQDDTFEQIETLYHLAPLPLLPTFLTRLPKVQRVIAFSSTSRFSKINAANVHEQAVAEGLQTAEKAVENTCSARGIAWTILRPTLIYGCAQDANVYFIARFIQRFGFFPLAGGGLGLRQPVHAEDLAQACLQVTGQQPCFNQAYNLSGGETLTYGDMVRMIFAGLQKPPRLLSIPVWAFRWGILMLGRLRPFRAVSLSMVERMNTDLCFGHESAQRDFAYQPRGFKPDAVALGVSKT